MSGYRQRLGRWGEKVAAEFLTGQGYIVLDHNVRTPYGELDLVTCQDSEEGRVMVFVEVKTRSSYRFGYPEESVTAVKQAHLLSAAQAFLQLHPEMEGLWRVDVIAIRRGPSGTPPEIQHFQNVVRG